MCFALIVRARSSSLQLFRHLAECLHEFMLKENLLSTGLCYPLGRVAECEARFG